MIFLTPKLLCEFSNYWFNFKVDWLVFLLCQDINRNRVLIAILIENGIGNRICKKG